MQFCNFGIHFFLKKIRIQVKNYDVLNPQTQKDKHYQSHKTGFWVVLTSLISYHVFGMFAAAFWALM